MRYWQPPATPGLPRVGICVATYNQTHVLSSLLFALRAQTYARFTCEVWHDGPWNNAAALVYEKAAESDKRFSMRASSERENVFGHNLRQFFLLTAGRFDYVVLTNGDNWYAPVFLHEMVAVACAKKAQLVYCNCVHSHKLWRPMQTALVRGQVDVGCLLVEGALAQATPWTRREFAADWTWLSALLKKTRRVAKVEGTLFVHN